MSTYVISDIHGHYDRWQDILNQIKFTSDDKMIVIGDAIDRGPDGVKVLQDIKVMPNVHMMLGNHELMMLECWCNPGDKDIQENWMYNGGYPTVEAMMKLPHSEQEEIINWLRNSVCAGWTKTSDGREFQLVHGFTTETPESEKAKYVFECVWNRPESRTSKGTPKHNRTLIIGHTPVANLYSFTENNEMSKSHYRIMHAPHFINLDCGSGHKYDGACLACLRLDDMREFYAL